jgi:hypothetical protein
MKFTKTQIYELKWMFPLINKGDSYKVILWNIDYIPGVDIISGQSNF